MKIVRFLHKQEIRYGVLKENNVQIIKDNIYQQINYTNETIPFSEIKLLNPVEPPNIIAIGLNYKQHAKESGYHSLPERPVIFLKATTSIVGPEDKIVLPAAAPDEVDYEAELVVIIKEKARDVSIEEADKYILGYTCGNDVSARDCQIRLDKQWARSKSFDTFCPVGPWIETELEPDNLSVKSRLNGKVMQEGNTNDMIFNVRELVSYCSHNMTLLPGTIIMTGTPPGVGFARKPPVYLRTGDIIEIEIEGIGILSNQVK